MPSIDSNFSATSINWDAAQNARVPSKQLDQDDFLRLLLTKLTSQDPLNPEKDSDFIAQMAQFSSLEQSKAMQADMAALRTEQQLLQASALIGHTVQIQMGDETVRAGIVAGVKVEDGTPKLMVDGQTYGLGQILTVTPTTQLPDGRVYATP